MIAQTFGTAVVQDPLPDFLPRKLRKFVSSLFNANSVIPFVKSQGAVNEQESICIALQCHIINIQNARKVLCTVCTD